MMLIYATELATIGWMHMIVRFGMKFTLQSSQTIWFNWLKIWISGHVLRISISCLVCLCFVEMLNPILRTNRDTSAWLNGLFAQSLSMREHLEHAFTFFLAVFQEIIRHFPPGTRIFRNDKGVCRKKLNKDWWLTWVEQGNIMPRPPVHCSDYCPQETVIMMQMWYKVFIDRHS